MERYINPDKIKLNSLSWIDGEGDILVPLVEVRKAIAQTPTEDVVAVVRCKECQHWKDTSLDTVTEDHWGECRKPLGDYRYCETAENDFCSYGERKEQI